LTQPAPGPHPRHPCPGNIQSHAANDGIFELKIPYAFWCVFYLGFILHNFPCAGSYFPVGKFVGMRGQFYCLNLYEPLWVRAFVHVRLCSFNFKTYMVIHNQGFLFRSYCINAASHLFLILSIPNIKFSTRFNFNFSTHLSASLV